MNIAAGEATIAAARVTLITAGNAAGEAVDAAGEAAITAAIIVLVTAGELLL